MPHRLIKTIDGPRGDFLLAGGLVFTAIGYSYVSTTTPGREAGFVWLPTHLDSDELGWVWVVVGLFTVTVALISARFKKLEALAFMVLVVPPTLWALIFIGAWLLGAHPNGWVSAISYSLMAWWVLIASDWPNPPCPPERKAEGGQRG